MNSQEVGSKRMEGKHWKMREGEGRGEADSGGRGVWMGYTPFPPLQVNLFFEILTSKYRDEEIFAWFVKQVLDVL